MRYAPSQAGILIQTKKLFKIVKILIFLCQNILKERM